MPFQEGKGVKHRAKRKREMVAVGLGAGLTREQVAEQVGMSPRSISAIEQFDVHTDDHLRALYEKARGVVLPKLIRLQETSIEKAQKALDSDATEPKDIAALLRESTHALKAVAPAEAKEEQPESVAALIATSEEARARALARAFEIMKEREAILVPSGKP